MKKSFLLVPTMAMAILSCSDEDNGNTQRWNPGKITVNTAEQAAIDNNNGFAIKMLQAAATESPKSNCVISPISITYNLAMTAAGAAGNTQSEIMNMLGFGDMTADEMNALCKKIMQESGKLDSRTTMYTANTMLTANSLTLKPEYASALKNFYQADAKGIDFSNTATAVKYINDWCAKNTNNMITKIIDDISETTRMMAINAVYFNGKWFNKFDKANTKDGRFTHEDGTDTFMPMMAQTEYFSYNETDNCQMVALPYGNGSFSMIVILPKDGKTLADVMTGMDARTWKTNIDEMEQREVDLKLPRFTTEQKYNLKNKLTTLGAPAMFTQGAADFSPMCNEPLFINEVIHSVKIIVNEEGTEAAAVTNNGLVGSPGPTDKKIFHADHPFIYSIVENSTGQIYFIGTLLR